MLVVEDMGKVGFRIADAKSLAERTTTAFRKRLGRDAVIYEGLLTHAKDMKRRLKGTETAIQDEQIAYYAGAAKHAQWRVKVKFGKKRGKHWITASCFRADGGKRKGKAVERRTWKAKRFDDVRETFAKELKVFCLEADPPKKAEEPAPISKPKKKKAWSLPPMRR